MTELGGYTPEDDLPSGPLSGREENDAKGPAGLDLLSELSKEVGKEVKLPLFTLDVNTRNHISLRYDPNAIADSNEVERWQNSARNKGGRDGYNLKRFAVLVIKNTCTAILYDGKVIPDADGEPCTFTSKAIHTMFNAIDASAAVDILFGGIDSHLIAHSNRVLAAGGYSENGMAVTEGDETPLVD
jgi:hypothetical protein